MTICMIGAGGFIGSHLCEKLLMDTPHKVLAVDVYSDKIKSLLEPSTLPWADKIQFTASTLKMILASKASFAWQILQIIADYLDMTDKYGDENLLSKSETFFQKHILRHWKNCIVALQSCEPFITRADKLRITSRCIDALSVMVCTDPSLFGWPMMMYGSLQNPECSILWNGIRTRATIHSTESDWWFQDISYLCVELFERLIREREVKCIQPENLASAIMYYCKKYILGLGRWPGGQMGTGRIVASFSMTPAAVDQRVLLESVVKLLPDKKGKSYCRFLLGLLRVALTLGVKSHVSELFGLENRHTARIGNLG